MYNKIFCLGGIEIGFLLDADPTKGDCRNIIWYKNKNKKSGLESSYLQYSTMLKIKANGTRRMKVCKIIHSQKENR